MLRAALALAVLALSLACSAPPDKERHQAEGAIAAARAADAVRYAPKALEMAESALAGYDAAVAQRDYREALRLALEARDTAFQAARDASDEKASVRSQAEQMITEGTTLLVSWDGRPASRTSARPTPGAEVSAGTLVPDARLALQEARSKLDQADYHGVVMLLEPIVASLRTEIGTGPSAVAATR